MLWTCGNGCAGSMASGREHRVHLAVEVFVEEGVLGSESSSSGAADRESRARGAAGGSAEPGLVQPGDEVVGAAGDLESAAPAGPCRRVAGPEARGSRRAGPAGRPRAPRRTRRGWRREIARNRSRSSSGFDGSRASSRTRSLKSSQLSSRLMNRLGSRAGPAGDRRRIRLGGGPLSCDSVVATRTIPIGDFATAQSRDADGSTGMQSIEPRREDDRCGGPDDLLHVTTSSLRILRLRTSRSSPSSIPLGVSRIIGRWRNRRSFTRCRKDSNPISRRRSPRACPRGCRTRGCYRSSARPGDGRFPSFRPIA